MVKVLVTGGQGQLGRQLRSQVACREDSGAWDFVGHAVLDITRPARVREVLRGGGYTHIINCAAYTAVDRAEDEPERAYAINAEGAGRVAAIARELGVFCIHVSTDYVFDGARPVPYSEGDVVAPCGVYGQSKRAGEVAVLSAGGAMVVRTSWLYSSHSPSFFRTIYAKCRAGDELRVVYDQVGSPTWAGSLAAALVHVVRSERRFEGVYHYCDSGVASWYDVAMAIRDGGGFSNTIFPIRSEAYPTRTRRPHYSVLDSARICREAGVQVSYWRAALRECLAEAAGGFYQEKY